jgi:hypothetical protein
MADAIRPDFHSDEDSGRGFQCEEGGNVFVPNFANLPSHHTVTIQKTMT